MPQSKTRKDQLKQLLKQKNISVSVLALQSGQSRSSLKSLFISSTTISEESFQFYKKIIDSIDTVNYYEKYIRGDVAVKREFPHGICLNKKRVHDFINNHNIKKSVAAKICNRTPTHFGTLINLSTQTRLSDKLANELISQLDNYVKQKN